MSKLFRAEIVGSLLQLTLSNSVASHKGDSTTADELLRLESKSPSFDLGCIFQATV